MDFRSVTTQHISQDHLTREILFHVGTVGKGIVSSAGYELTYFYFYFLAKDKIYTHNPKKCAVDDTNKFSTSKCMRFRRSYFTFWA